MEREPSLDPLAGRAGVRLVRPSGPSRSRRSRELRLRQRIDGLLWQRAAKERRILALEDRLRVALLPEHDRVVVLESRLKHANRRIIELNEQLREALAS